MLLSSKSSGESWKNVYSILCEHHLKAAELLTDDDLRVRIQFFAVYVLFAVSAFMMTIINIFTGWYYLMLSTAIFSVTNIVNLILTLISEKCEYLSRFLFSIEILILFGFFLIVGEPEGFSAIWILLLPTCGMLLYRLKIGVILSLIQFIFLAFLFWTKPGNSLLFYHGYTNAFMMRFPILYLVFMASGVFFEFLRAATQRELSETRTRYKHLSNHDILTGLFNRSGFNDYMKDIMQNTQNGYAFAIIDIDDFKKINDQYGHSDGDTVLSETARIISETVGDFGKASRWGGEEFAILFIDMEKSLSLCEKIRKKVSEKTFCFNKQNCNVTVSIGLTFFKPHENVEISRIFSNADNNMYLAKNQGKNCLISSFLPDLAETDSAE